MIGFHILPVKNLLVKCQKLNNQIHTRKINLVYGTILFRKEQNKNNNKILQINDRVGDAWYK